MTSDPQSAFSPDPHGLARAVELLITAEAPNDTAQLPADFPREGLGVIEVLELLADPVLAQSRDLGAPGFFAHMDPPTPWITWAMHLWTASRNQNLLHPDTAPVARELEATVIDWLAPAFGMTGGHLTPGSSVANLTALWAAREAGAHTVVATKDAHLSIAKSAHLLAMAFRPITDWSSAGELDGCAAVITAGTTSTGHIEPLDAAPSAAWRHVDAAWAGPLVLSEAHRGLLAGVEQADSVSVSVGVLGSHGAIAVPLLATLLAYGRNGVASWIDHSMTLTDELYRLVKNHPKLEARTAPQAGVLNWRHTELAPAKVQQQLPAHVFVSVTTIDGEPWMRSVGATPMADPSLVVETVAQLPD